MKKYIIIGALLGTIAVGRAASLVQLNGLFYTWPAAHAAKALTNDSAGTLAWSGDIDSGVPSGLIGFWVSSGSCPSGWAEYTSARGRYIVNGTSIGTTVGTAIDSNGSENRTAGVHGHSASITASISDSAHNHTDSASNHDHDGIIVQMASTNLTTDGGAWVDAMTNAVTTGISLQNANANISASPNLTVSAPSGAVAGTNAPYIRVLVCQKS